MCPLRKRILFQSELERVKISFQMNVHGGNCDAEPYQRIDSPPRSHYACGLNLAVYTVSTLFYAI